MNNDLLFVYGSLLNEGNAFGNYLMRNACFVATTLFKGRLYNCGEYPGAIADINGYDIKGSIYQLRDTTTALVVLDDYEGYGIEQEQPNLFVRKLISVTCNNKTAECWIYIYNLPVYDLTEITSGDYMTYIKA